jgi:hypothetical protein
LENVLASRTGLDNGIVVNVVISAIDNNILFSPSRFYDGLVDIPVSCIVNDEAVSSVSNMQSSSTKLPAVSNQVSSSEMSFSPLASFFWSFFSSFDLVFQNTQAFFQDLKRIRGHTKGYSED